VVPLEEQQQATIQEIMDGQLLLVHLLEVSHLLVEHDND
jgi:hypothetical protein